jgi:hypothetical protein
VPNPGCLFIGHGPKTLPVTWLTGNQIINFSNSPDQQAEGYLDLPTTQIITVSVYSDNYYRDSDDG